MRKLKQVNLFLYWHNIYRQLFNLRHPNWPQYLIFYWYILWLLDFFLSLLLLFLAHPLLWLHRIYISFLGNFLANQLHHYWDIFGVQVFYNQFFQRSEEMNGVLDLLKVLDVKLSDSCNIQTSDKFILEVLRVTVWFRVAIGYLEWCQFVLEPIHQILREMLVIAILVMNTKRSQFSHISQPLIELFKLFYRCIRQRVLEVNLEMLQRMAAREDVSEEETV